MKNEWVNNKKTLTVVLGNEIIHMWRSYQASNKHVPFHKESDVLID